MSHTNTFKRFFESERSSALVLIACTVVSLLLANSKGGAAYINLWQTNLGGVTIVHWINDGLMAAFFLMVGLELERELYSGELSSRGKAMLPLFAALGGMLTPAIIHYAFNAGSPTQSGIGIPMATDIAFALGAIALLGSRAPASLKVFVVAFAVIDDLGAIIIIAAFYTPKLVGAYLLAAAAVFIGLVIMNRTMRVMRLTPYLIGGGLLWFFLLKSGVHATLAGVLLAFAIPYSSIDEDRQSPSHRLENWLHQPIAFFVLPLFALANTAIAIPPTWIQELTSSNSLGIVAGLVLGKPLGVICFSLLGVALHLCQLPEDLRWSHIFGAGLLGGIGFTMSIFIATLAFPGAPALIDSSKVAILTASLAASLLGYAWLRWCAK